MSGDRATQVELEVRTLGGFSAHLGPDEVTLLESQRVRALLVLLLLRGGLDRGATARLLWSLEDSGTARRNLRQALYNLRTSLEAARVEIAADRHRIDLEGRERCRLDVTEFRKAVVQARTAEDRGEEVAALGRASALYRGDFLAGNWFDSPEFEDWLVATQEELRNLAVEVLQTLVERCADDGDLTGGVEHAKRWLELDPLAEQAHRFLMRVYGRTGRRGQALAQYEVCRHRLEVELGAEPLPETTGLYRELLGEQLREVGLEQEPRPVAPTLPLVGRRDAYLRLFQIWERTAKGAGSLTLLVGSPGAGKTRLLKAFTHDAASAREAMVLQTRCLRGAVRVPYQAFAELVDSLRSTTPELWGLLRGRWPVLEAVLPASTATIRDVDELARAWTLAMELLVEKTGSAIIVLFDDVQAADPATQALLELLVPGLRHLPVWILGSWTRRGRRPPGFDGATLVELERLKPADLRDLGRQILVDPLEAASLASFLIRRTGGIPLGVAEWVNLLGDEGALTRTRDGWHLTEDPEVRFGRLDADQVVERRVATLPSSTRRLLTLAAVIGPAFDAGFLADVANEDLRVVERGLEILLKRWMIRPTSRVWFESIGAREIEGFARGPTGRFEMVHARFRRKVYRQLAVHRRRYLHQEIFETLRHRGDDAPEVLARHAIAAGAWAEAEEYLERSIERARRLAADDVASDHGRLLDRLRREAATAVEE